MKTKFLLAAMFAFSVVMGFVGSTTAAGFSYTVETDVFVAADLKTRVETTIDATAGSGASVPGSITIPRYGVDVTDLRAVDSQDTEITVEQSELGIVLRLNVFQGRAADDWSVRVTYNSTSGLGLGDSALILLPPFDYGELNVSDEQLRITSDAELGAFVTRGGAPSDSTTIGGSFVTTWRNDDGPLVSPVGMLFGDASLADVTFNRTLENTSFWWQTQSFVLPPDTNQQQVFIRELSPKPSNVRLDVDGNVIAEYRLRPRQNLEVSARVEAVVNSYTYALDSDRLLNDIDATLIERYTNLNETWPDTVVTIDEPQTTPVRELVEQIYDAITAEFAQPQGESGYDRALARANPLVGELRANQVPARVVIGAVFGDGARAFPSPQPHAWVEAYLPDVGWVTLDPSFEQNGDYFGVADVQRVALALRGLEPDYPPGNLSDFTVTFSTEEPPAIPVMKPEITATKHMILPGLSIDTVQISMPDGVIVDNAGVVVGSDQARILGSLAPFQEVNIRSASFLAAAFTSEAVQYGVFGESGALAESDIVVQTTSSVSYLPMLAIIVLATLGFLVYRFVIPRLGQRKKNKAKKEKSRQRGLQVGHDKNGDDIENVDMLAALDLPKEEEAPQQHVDASENDTDPQPEPRKVSRPTPRPIQTTGGATGKPFKPAVPQASPPKPEPQKPQPLSVGQAHDASPEEIRQALHKKQKNLIQ